MTPQNERLNKVLAQLGYGSRRSTDELIEAGRVAINGQQAELGQRVAPNDTITLDGKSIGREKPRTVVLAFHKPRGVTTTKKDKYAKVTVMEYLPKQFQHLFPIGRLDRDSRGLLLFTNDGDLALKLEHPRYEHEKEYVVDVIPNKRCDLSIFKQDMIRMSKEVIDQEHQTKPAQVTQFTYDGKLKRGHARIILKEGKKRQIRHLLQALGYFVSDLQRVRIGSIRLGDIPEGKYVELKPEELL
ncbi:MAG TPA: pseudouridine synthase [Patescibacteria group bacterium]